MNASKSEPGAARWLRVGLCCGLVALLGGCADSDEGAIDAANDEGVPFPPPDVGGDVGPDVGACQLTFADRCVDDRDVRCEVVAEWIADRGCTDADDDCFLAGCEAAAETVIADCDDTRPEVNPLGEQSCNGLDGDCDGRVDEGFELGASCDGCGVAGKVECAVDDPTQTACSTAAGQSDARDPLPEELCNGVDDDCDAVVDEACRIPSRLVPPREPSICPDGRVALVEDGALVVATPLAEGGFSFETLRPAEAGAARPDCGALGLAWLELGPELGPGGCTTPVDGPERCEAELWAAFTSESPRMLAPLGALGPPRVGEARVYWHTLPGPEAFILGRGPGEDAARQVFDRAFSDPTPPVAGQMLVREWVDGTPRATLVNLGVDGEPGTGRGVVDEPPRALGHPGPAVRSAGWMAWPIQGERTTLWVVSQENPRAGFFPVSHPGPQRAPRLAGERLVWIDEGTSPPTLRALDLGTGTERVIATGQIASDGIALGPTAVVWIEGAEGRLYYRGLSPIGD